MSISSPEVGAALCRLRALWQQTHAPFDLPGYAPSRHIPFDNKSLETCTLALGLIVCVNCPYRSLLVTDVVSHRHGSGTTRPLDPDPGHALRSTRVSGHLGHDIHRIQCDARQFHSRPHCFWQWPPIQDKILRPLLLSSRTASAPPTSTHYQLARSHLRLRFQNKQRLLPPTPTISPPTTASWHQRSFPRLSSPRSPLPPCLTITRLTRTSTSCHLAFSTGLPDTTSPTSTRPLDLAAPDQQRPANRSPEEALTYNPKKTIQVLRVLWRHPHPPTSGHPIASVDREILRLMNKHGPVTKPSVGS